jgi:hypothetical protein
MKMTHFLDNAERDKRAFSLAFEYLLTADKRVTKEIVKQHLSHPNRPKDIQSIFRHVVMSAKNAGMMGNVIGKIEDNDNYKEILCNFNPSVIIQRYHGNWQELLDCLIAEKAKTRPTIKPGKIWRSYCQSLIDGAYFLNRFSTTQEFHDFVSIFHDNPDALPALPCLLAKEMHGFGFALACDFLKEIGYYNFSKPDTYLKEILPKLELSANSDDLVVFRAVTRIAGNAATTAFAVDKLFWLIGSGKFHISNLEIGSHSDAFIAWAKPQLE